MKKGHIITKNEEKILKAKPWDGIEKRYNFEKIDSYLTNLFKPEPIIKESAFKSAFKKTKR
jgi:hypothetical protein